MDDQDKNASYLHDLELEKEKLQPFSLVLPNCVKLLDREINRVKKKLSNPKQNPPLNANEGSETPECRTVGEGQTDKFDLNSQGIDETHEEDEEDEEVEEKRVVITEADIVVEDCGNHKRVYVPVDKFPHYNFIGRILGPKGQYLRKIEQDTGCKIAIRGKGSRRNKEEEEKLFGKSGYEHLKMPLHVTIEPGEKSDDDLLSELCPPDVNRAVKIMQKLLIPIDEENDKLKSRQLKELAAYKTRVREEQAKQQLFNSSIANMGMHMFPSNDRSPRGHSNKWHHKPSNRNPNRMAASHNNQFGYSNNPMPMPYANKKRKFQEVAGGSNPASMTSSSNSANLQQQQQQQQQHMHQQMHMHQMGYANNANPMSMYEYSAYANNPYNSYYTM